MERQPISLPPPLIALLDAPRPGLRWYHEIGRHVRRLTSTRQYAERVMERVAHEIGSKNRSLTLDVLYRCVKFVSMYPNSREVAEWQKRGLSWNHVKHLLGIKDEDLRSGLLQNALQQGWSCRELSKEIVREGGVRPRRGVRRMNAPQPLNDQADMERLVKQNEDWLLLWESVWQLKKKLSPIQDWEQAERGEAAAKEALQQLRSMRSAIRQLESALSLATRR